MISEARNIVAIVVAFAAPFIFFSASNAPRASFNYASYNFDSSSSPPLARLQTYLRIRTDHPRPDYHTAVQFLNTTILTLLPNATITTREFIPNKPVLLATILGTNEKNGQTKLKSVLLNSHMDVVPAETQKWTTDPFSASFRTGSVYARGAQDMKSVGMQYVEALSQMLSSGWTPKRTIHISFVPDEEIGGRDGMGELTDHIITHPIDNNNNTISSRSSNNRNDDILANLNIGVALDEGEPSETDRFQLFYGERRNWWVEIQCIGQPGHGATFPQITAVQVLHMIISNALKFRSTQREKLISSNGDLKLGDVVSLNVAFIESGTSASSGSGYTMNVIPSRARAGFDIRIPPTLSSVDMDKEIQSWLIDVCCGVNASVIYHHRSNSSVVTSSNPYENPYVIPFERGIKDAGITDKLDRGIFFAATDSRYLRDLNIPCFGFSPIRNIPNLMHKHDEYITAKGYLDGIEIYKPIIRQLADFDPDSEAQIKTTTTTTSSPSSSPSTTTTTELTDQSSSSSISSSTSPSTANTEDQIVDHEEL